MDLSKMALGIEFGSTRIKAVLINEKHKIIVQGECHWENHLENGIWTYSLPEIWKGLQTAYAALAEEYALRYGEPITTVGCIGVSAMMHGYLPFDKNDCLLVPFRTWRNTITERAAKELTELFGVNIPQRWSIAHYYQAILDKEKHIPEVAFFTTLSGYIHWQLTGQKVLGVGDASGMFPIDSRTGTYDVAMLQKFEKLTGTDLTALLPKVLLAGFSAGTLTKRGAQLLDPTGILQPGVMLCPPEGDAGTGMTATNSVAPRTGNVSAGTSIFAMVVLERPLSKIYPEIDLVMTPAGDLVAMVHCNNCTSDLNAWINQYAEFAALYGMSIDQKKLYEELFKKSLQGKPDCGGIVPVNYYSGEGVTHFNEGRPLLVRNPDSDFSLANLMKAHIYSTMATLKIGLDILSEEAVETDKLMGHGGLFKTPGVAQRYLAAASKVPVTVMKTAGEGGSYGMALLAAYCIAVKGRTSLTLTQYLEQEVFAGAEISMQQPVAEDVEGFNTFLKKYKKALFIEQAALEHL